MKSFNGLFTSTEPKAKITKSDLFNYYEVSKFDLDFPPRGKTLQILKNKLIVIDTVSISISKEKYTEQWGTGKKQYAGIPAAVFVEKEDVQTSRRLLNRNVFRFDLELNKIVVESTDSLTPLDFPSGDGVKIDMEVFLNNLNTELSDHQKESFIKQLQNEEIVYIGHVI